MEKFEATDIVQDSDGTVTPVDLRSITDKGNGVEPIALTVKHFLSLGNGEQNDPQSARIVMDNVTVEGSGTGVSCSSFSGQVTGKLTGEKALPAPSIVTEAKSGFGLLEPITSRVHRPSSRPILRNFSVAIQPGEMILVIGKPGSGCTTFLKTLAGMWDEYKSIQGSLTLGGQPINSVIDEHPQDIVFCGESLFIAPSFFSKDLHD